MYSSRRKVEQLGHLARNCSGNGLGNKKSAPLSKDMTLPVIDVRVDGIQSTALVDTGCFHTLMSRSVFSSLQE